MARRSIPSSGPTRRTSWPRSGGLASHWSWPGGAASRDHGRDRKSTRLNSSHSQISYAVFCLKKKSQSFGVGFEAQNIIHAAHRQAKKTAADASLILVEQGRHIDDFGHLLADQLGHKRSAPNP